MPKQILARLLPKGCHADIGWRVQEYKLLHYQLDTGDW